MSIPLIVIGAVIVYGTAFFSKQTRPLVDFFISIPIGVLLIGVGCITLFE